MPTCWGDLSWTNEVLKLHNNSHRPLDIDCWETEKIFFGHDCDLCKIIIRNMLTHFFPNCLVLVWLIELQQVTAIIMTKNNFWAYTWKQKLFSCPKDHSREYVNLINHVTHVNIQTFKTLNIFLMIKY